MRHRTRKQDTDNEDDEADDTASIIPVWRTAKTEGVWRQVVCNEYREPLDIEEDDVDRWLTAHNHHNSSAMEDDDYIAGIDNLSALN